MSIFLISDCIFEKEIKLLYIPVRRRDTLRVLLYWDPHVLGLRVCVCVCAITRRAIMGAP